MYESTSSIASFDLSKLYDPSKDSKVLKQSNPSLPPMYRSSDQTAKFNSSNSLQQTHLLHQTAKKESKHVDLFPVIHLQQQGPKTSQRKMSLNHEEYLTKQKYDKSLSINIKSNTRELIESKDYEYKISNEWQPVFPQFNQEESMNIDDSGKGKKQMKEQMMIQAEMKRKETKNFTPINNSNVKRVVSKWLEEDAQERQQSSEQQFIKNHDLFTSSQDVQKLSQIYNELQLKNDTKTIKKLNSTNQELKTICKQIISLLRFDPMNGKRKVNDDLIISKVYKIITNYQHKKNNANEKEM